LAGPFLLHFGLENTYQLKLQSVEPLDNHRREVFEDLPLDPAKWDD